MISIILNVITLIIVGAVVGVFLFLYSQRKNKQDTASDILFQQIKDPLVTSRAYFTEPATGPIGDFVGLSSSAWSGDTWVNSISKGDENV